jgi:prophage antirepressor-like protein
MKAIFFRDHVLTYITKDDKPWFLIRDLAGLVPNLRQNLPPNEVIDVKLAEGRSRPNRLVSSHGLRTAIQTLSWEHQSEFLAWLSEQFEPEPEPRPNIWTAVGEVLAGLDHSKVTPHARTKIREAIERATGTKAP